MDQDRPEPNRHKSESRFPFDGVVLLCEEFTSEWEPVHRPSIPSYLDRVADDARATLLRNLLQYEVQRRRQEGELPQAEEYIKRFPQFPSLVRQVFLESTSLSLNPDRSSERSGTVDYQPLVATRLGDYRLIRELGRGGMGVVFEAVHVLRGDRVALKMLPQVDGAQLYRFKREFRSAADISHPNLIGLHSLESDGAQWFFTMDLIEGVDFLDYVRPGGPLDLPRLRSAFSQLVMGVMALHRNHIIHRDLKPSNVMVTHDGHVILLDFGLVVELDQPGATQSTDKIAGTPAYMAPEQAAATVVTPACDWYAVGVMLYEALAGARPFNGTLWQILQDKQALDPPPLPQDQAIPEDLATLCLRLLARDPRQRPDAFEIAKQAASGFGSESAATAGSGGHPIVGRDQHLASLKDAYRALQRHREPQTVFISGRSGEGKTTLGEHFLAPLRQDKNLAVMSGRCYDRESVPFKALDSLIDTLAGYLRALPQTDAAILMPDDIWVLARVFPVLLRVEVVAKAAEVRTSALDEQQVRQRAFAALRSLVTRISRRSPVIWFIDDLQWGDADSAEVMFELLRPPDAPLMLFIGTYRSDETEGSAFLAAWKDLQRKHDIQLRRPRSQAGAASPSRNAPSWSSTCWARTTNASAGGPSSSRRKRGATRSCSSSSSAASIPRPTRSSRCRCTRCWAGSWAVYLTRRATCWRSSPCRGSRCHWRRRHARRDTHCRQWPPSPGCATSDSCAWSVPMRGRWSIRTMTAYGKRSLAGWTMERAGPFTARLRRLSKRRSGAAPDELEAESGELGEGCGT